MKFTKKILAILMALLLAAAVMPAAFAADDDVIANGSCGEGITWTLTEGGLLTVRGNGPIVDEEEVEYDDEGYASTSKLDCLGWQLYGLFEERTEELDAKERAYALFDFIKEIVIEEGITDIPSGEFSDFYPRHITLPASLKSINSSCVDARFAETLTINCKDAEINGNISISGYNKNAEPFESLDEAIEATVNCDAASREIDELQSPIYDLGSAYEIKLGLSEDITEKEFVANLNEFYGSGFEDLDDCMAYFIEKINDNFGRNYESADQIFTVVTEEEYSYLERNSDLDEQISGMYEAAAIDEDKLVDMNLGAIEGEDIVAYSWLTVYGPSGSGAESAAKTSGVNFAATTEPEAPGGFIGKIKAAYETVKAFFVRIIYWLRMYLPIFK